MSAKEAYYIILDVKRHKKYIIKSSDLRHKIWAPHISMDHEYQEPGQLTVA